jgi:2-polyprenyl-3-methyl-5-hydroxy-6-metoxy-1,4-benzoquinol methylase
MNSTVIPGLRLFKRADQTYAVHKDVLAGVVADDASPLLRIAKLLPQGSRVLDAGAGNGIFADVAKTLNLDITLDGLEPNQAGATLAASKYSTFYCSTLETLESEKNYHQAYDAIVLADVIEHTTDPQEFLTTAKTLLKPSGRMYISVPNVAYASLRASLLCGQWRYSDWGLLERTHLRFLTKDTMLELAKSVSMHVERIQFLMRNPFEMDIKLQELRLSPFAVRSIEKDPLAAVYQFVFVLSLGTERTMCEEWYGYFPKNLTFAYLQRRWSCQ